MTIIVNADLTGLQTFPNIADFVLGVPLTGLVGLFRASRGIVMGTGVASWAGALGSTASQATTGKQPAFTSGHVAPDGVDDYLASNLIAPASGYLVAKVKAKTNTGSNVIVGGSTSSTQRCGLGTQTLMKAGCQIGNKTVSTFVGTTVMVDGTDYVIAGSWAAGNAAIRVNGVQEATTTYTGDAGTQAMFIGALNNAGAASAFCPFHIEALALYTGTGLDLAAIDAAMAAF